MSYEILREIDTNKKFSGCSIGGAYSGEEGQESDLRLNVLSGLVARLKKTIEAADNFKKQRIPGSNQNVGVTFSGYDRTSKAPVVGPGAANTGGVKDLVKWHMQAQQNVMDGDRLNDEVIRVRRWITRQGAKLTVRGQVIWDVSHRRVEYDNDLQKQAMTKVTLRGGKMYTADGKLLDTSEMVTVFSGPGYAIYVLSKEGNIHVGSHSISHRHHSSLLAGSKTNCAGEMRVIQGELKHLSNKSGHYTPDVFNLLKMLQVLEDGGIAFNFSVESLGAGFQSVRYASVDDFMRTNMFDDENYRKSKAALARTQVVPANLASSQGDSFYYTRPGASTPSGGYVYSQPSIGNSPAPASSGGYMHYRQIQDTNAPASSPETVSYYVVSGPVSIPAGYNNVDLVIRYV